MDNPQLQRANLPTAPVIADRINGCIFGAICANSLAGSSIGLNYKEIAGTVGLSGLRDFAPGLSRSLSPDHKPGELLADSYLALALGESLLASQGKFDPIDLKTRLEILLTDATFLATSPGVPCIAALRHMADGDEPDKEGPAATHANVAARAFPAGCLPGRGQSDEPVAVAVRQAQLTHGDSRAAAASAVVADTVNYFIAGGRLDSAEDVRNYVRREMEIAESLDQRFAESWDDVAPDLDYAHPADELPYSLINVESNVNELIPTAVGIFLIFRHSAEEAICAAARSGGDTDTVAAVVGALSGAYHGASQLPDRWLSKIHEKSRIANLADGLAKFWH